MNYNTRFRMKDLLMNPNLENVFPQFDRSAPLKNTYSFAEVERRVLEYLKNALNGTIKGKDELVVKGKHPTIMRRVRELQPLIESLFDNMPSVAKNLRGNTRLYTTFASLDELENIKGYQKKLAALKTLVDNINYNPDFNSQNSIPSQARASYLKRQDAWKKRVGYKE